MQKKSIVNRLRRVPSGGFSLLELMISAAVIVLTLVALQAFLDQTQWMYVQTGKRSNVQQNARMAMEQMERDIRMIGYGVPTGSEIGGSDVWTPSLFRAGQDDIYFRAGIENGTSLLTSNVTSTATTLPVENSFYYEGLIAGGPVPFVIVEDSSSWKGLICSAASSNTLTLTGTTGRAFNADETEVHALQHIFYQFVSSGTYPFGRIERNQVNGNAPLTTPGTFEVLAKQIMSMTFSYYQSDGTALTGDPLSDANSELVSSVEITIVGRERSSRPGQYQDFTLRSRVLIRNRNL